MGTQFFWFYDVLILAIFVAIIYKGIRRGFASMAVEIIGGVLSFVIALSLCSPLANLVYDNLVAPAIKEKISYTASDANKNTPLATFETLRNADMSKANFTGKTIDELDREISAQIKNESKNSSKNSSLEKVSIDLSNITLNETGIPEGDLGFLGVNVNFAKMPRNLGRVDITTSELSRYELGDIILSKIISKEIAENAKANNENLIKILEDTIPAFSKVSMGEIDLVSMLIIGVIDSDYANLETVVSDALVRPVLIVPFKTLIFTIIFALIGIIVSVVSKSLNILNNIPLFGKINTALGAVSGIIQAVVVIFIVCIGIRIIITLTADNIIFLNNMTISETFIFKHIYNIKFLNF